MGFDGSVGCPSPDHGGPSPGDGAPETNSGGPWSRSDGHPALLIDRRRSAS